MASDKAVEHDAEMYDEEKEGGDIRNEQDNRDEPAKIGGADEEDAPAKRQRTETPKSSGKQLADADEVEPAAAPLGNE